MESLLFPDEIVLKILGYLSLGQLIQCARVSKRWKNICKDRSLSYRSNMLVMKRLNNICKDRTLSYRSSILEMKDLTLKDRKTIIDTLIDRPEVTKLIMSSKKTQRYLVQGKAPLHVMIYQNKLYFRWKPFDLRIIRDYYLHTFSNLLKNIS